MTARVVALRAGDGDQAAVAGEALAVFEEHLERAALAADTVTAYRRQGRAYLAWLAGRPGQHPDAFVDQVGAEGAIAAWRRELLAAGRSAATVNQALAAGALLYQVGRHLRPAVTRARVPRPGAPDALTRVDEARVRRAADRRGPRDAAVVALLVGTGARVAECARLRVPDVPVTARTGTARL